jgi:Protein of unknown function (DUF1203)
MPFIFWRKIHVHSLFRSDQLPCFSLLSIWPKSAKVPAVSPFLAFRAILSLFFRKITLFLGKQLKERLRKRTLAVRSFDANGIMVDNRLVDGQDLEPAIEKLLMPTNVEYLHLHFAAAGCYAAKVHRA